MAADLSSIFDAAAAEWNVDPTLLRAVSAQESGGNAGAVSKAGARGLMGVMPETGRAMGVTDPTDPVQNIYAGAKYLSQALDAEKSPQDALRYYHGGPDWRNAYGPESKGYVPAVSAHYQRIAGATPVAAAKSDTTDEFLSGEIDPAPSVTQQAAPDAVDDFLSGKSGVEPPPAAPSAPQTSARGVAKNVAAGAIDAGANTFNFLTDPIGNLGKIPAVAGAFAHDALAPVFGYQRFPDDVRAMLLGEQVPQKGTALVNALSAATGVDPSAVPATDAERMTRKAVGAMGTVAALAPGAAPLLAAGVGSGVGDAAGQAAPEWAKPAAELAGNLVGGGATLPGAKVAGYLGKSVAGTTGGIAPEVAQLAQLARDKYGIPLNAADLSGNSIVRIANDQSSKLPFSGAAPAAAAKLDAWQRAVSQQMGEDTARITPDVMRSAATRIGDVFDSVAKRTTIQADQPLLTDLGRIQAEALQTLPTSEHGPINAQLNSLVDAAAKGNGAISGEAYQALTRQGAPLQRATKSSDPNVAFYARQIRDALDDAFQRSAAPQDQAALSQARSQWRAMRTIEDSVEKSVDGNISPALLMQQVRSASSKFDSSTGGMAYTGGGNLGDLARIGQLLKPAPNSGTPDRLLVNSLLGGGAVASVLAHPLSAAGIPAGLAANRLVGGYLRGPGFAGRAINNSLSPPPPVSLLDQAAPTALFGYNALSAGGGR